jgi:hypothetical protein
MVFTRRALILLLAEERSNLQQAIDALEKYTAARSRRKMMQENLRPHTSIHRAVRAAQERARRAR